MVVDTDMSGQPVGPILNSQVVQDTVYPLKMGPMGCPPKMAVENYHSMLSKIPNECTSHLQCSKV